jgi:hypothetical protein
MAEDPKMNKGKEFCTGFGFFLLVLPEKTTYFKVKSC